MNDALPTPTDDLARLQALLAAADPAGGSTPAVGVDAARQAQALALALSRPLEHARAGSRLCVQRVRMGHYADVITDSAAALALLRAPEHRSELAADERQLLRAVTLAASETGRFDLALDAANELLRLTGPLGAAAESLGAAFALGACFERMGDSWQAMRVVEQALASHGAAAPESARLPLLNMQCAIGIGLFHRLNGAADVAEVAQVLERTRAAGNQALALLETTPDRSAEVAIRGNLGEVKLHLGEFSAACTLLQQAHQLASQGGMQGYAWRIATSLADLQLAQGQPELALAAMNRLIDDMAHVAPPQTAIRAHHAAYRACRERGHFEDALRHFEVMERLERLRTTQQLRAQSELFVTRTEVQHAQWQTEQARLDAQAQRQRAREYAVHAERDPLTGLGNRRYFDRRCAELLPAAQRDAQAVSLLLMDVDSFKAINDCHGHPVGDRVLVALARLLGENTRTVDVLARHGGEEFVILLPGLGLDQAVEVCERLRRCVAEQADFALQPGLCVTASLGLAAAPGYDVQGLLKRADLALYQAKREGRNRLCVAP